MLEWNQIIFLVVGACISFVVLYFYFDQKYLKKMDGLRKKVIAHAELMKTQWAERESELFVGFKKKKEEWVQSSALVKKQLVQTQQEAQNLKEQYQNMISLKEQEAFDFYSKIAKEINGEGWGGVGVMKEAAAMAQVVEKLSQYRKHFYQINEHIEALEEISQQTRILALNAAVEAARAGESGKSFGQISLEMQELSITSSQTSKNISEIVHTVESEIKQVKQFAEVNAKNSNESMKALHKKLKNIVEAGSPNRKKIA